MSEDELEKRRARLSPERLARLAAQVSGGAKSADVGFRRRRELSERPLSYAQERVWFLQQLDPQSPAYNETVAYRICGPLRPHHLARALDELIRRHEVLRTTFLLVEGKLTQVVRSTRQGEAPAIEDLSHLPQGEREQAIQRRLAAAAVTPFDLAVQPPLRTQLLRLEDQEHVAIISLHHVACDGWSMGVFMRELVTLYLAFDAHQCSPLPEPIFQYADFADRQRTELEGPRLTTALAFWKRFLAGAPPALNLNAGRSLGSPARFRGRQLPLVISREDAEAIKRLARTEEATLYVVLLSVFLILLHRYTSEDDLVVGSPVAGRDLPGTESLIGCFVNPVVLRVSASGAPTVRELLRRTRETVVAALAYQYLPFELLVQELQPVRTMDRTPLFQIMFVLQNFATAKEKPSELRVSQIDPETTVAKFDLSLVLEETIQGIRGFVEYAEHVLEHRVARQLRDHYIRLLASAVQNPDQRISDLAMLDPEEFRSILARAARANRSQSPSPPSETVVALVERQSRQTPLALAAVHGEAGLTYGELIDGANQIARRLSGHGVVPGTRIGLALHRSLNWLVSLLGIFKAGGVLVPVSPDDPPLRLAQLLKQADVRLLLADESFPALQEWEGAVITSVGRNDELDPATRTNPRPPGREDEAYLMFTSGSTGEPKAVAIPHRALANHCDAIATAYELSATDRVLQFTSATFDVAFEEIFPTWVAGGTVVIPRLATAPPVDELSKVITAERISVLNLPASYWAVWLGHLEQTAVPTWNLRLVVVGSEPVLARDLARWRRIVPRTRWLCAYGVTEATITSTLLEPPDSYRDEVGQVPIGRSIAHVELYVVDKYRNLLPEGVAGELAIGGQGVALGYAGQPVQTAAKFVTGSPGKPPAGALFLTGDRARLREDGAFEWLGRLDDQIKFHGYRIEPGEIEQLLLRHPAIRQATVTYVQEAIGDSAASDSLIAAVVPQIGAEPQEKELRRYLSERLPAWMVPARIDIRTALPLTPHGKIDRRKLTAEAAGGVRGTPARIPYQAKHEVISAIWADALGRDAIGLDDHFFDAGGHSLLAARVSSLLHEHLGLDVPVRRFFDYPILGDFITVIEKDHSSAVVIPRSLRDQSLPLSPAQENLWSLVRTQEPRFAFFNMHKHALVRGDLDLDLLHHCYATVVERHEALRTTFPRHGIETIPVIHPTGNGFQPARLDLSALPEGQRHDQARVILRGHARWPFDLERELPIHVLIVRLSVQEHLITIVVHHLAADAVSLECITREVAHLYQRLRAGEVPRLPELPVQYSDFAVWQRHQDFSQEFAFWRTILADAPPAVSIPTRSWPRAPSFRYGRVVQALSGDVVCILRSVGRQLAASRFMVIVAALVTILQKVSRCQDIILGILTSGRNRPELEPVVGLFVNTIPLRIRLSELKVFRELVRSVRSATLAGLEHQSLPFEVLWDRLLAQNDSLPNPLFRILVNHLHSDQTPSETTDLEIGGFDLGSTDSEFLPSVHDVILTVEEYRDRVNLTFQFREDVFQMEEIHAFIRQYLEVLSMLRPDLPLRGLGK